MRKAADRDNIKIKLMSGVLILWAGFCFSCRTETPEKNEALQSSASQIRVKLGVEVFFEKHLDLAKGKNVGLITNPSGVTRDLKSTVDLFASCPDIKLVALYGPEHGIRGNAQAGEYVPFYFDDLYKIPVFSLYGQSEKPEPGMLKNIDEYMRSFDTAHIGKIPNSSMIGDVDIMVFDIQDVGTRVYTFIATMAYAMQSCAENGIDFVVLDRPNPINGITMEGPILEYPEFSSFVGLYPIPLRHGMTAGELALMFNDRFLKTKAHLTVIPMEGWGRELWYDGTGVPWVIPSPNMPTLETAEVYPGQVLLEGTNISEGRGTTKPFELFGAPWIDGHELTKALNLLDLPGIKFREAWFTPTFSKYQGELCGGAQIHVINRELYKPFVSALQVIQTVRQLNPGYFAFHADYFDKIMGTSKIRKAMESGQSIDEIASSLRQRIEEFSTLRKTYLLY